MSEPTDIDLVAACDAWIRSRSIAWGLDQESYDDAVRLVLQWILKTVGERWSPTRASDAIREWAKRHAAGRRTA